MRFAVPFSGLCSISPDFNPGRDGNVARELAALTIAKKQIEPVRSRSESAQLDRDILLHLKQA